MNQKKRSIDSNLEPELIASQKISFEKCLQRQEIEHPNYESLKFHFLHFQSF